MPPHISMWARALHFRPDYTEPQQLSDSFWYLHPPWTWLLISAHTLDMASDISPHRGHGFWYLPTPWTWLLISPHTLDMASDICTHRGHGFWYLHTPWTWLLISPHTVDYCYLQQKQYEYITDLHTVPSGICHRTYQLWISRPGYVIGHKPVFWTIGWCIYSRNNIIWRISRLNLGFT